MVWRVSAQFYGFAEACAADGGVDDFLTDAADREAHGAFEGEVSVEPMEQVLPS